jgi:hypothetical protein
MDEQQIKDQNGMDLVSFKIEAFDESIEDATVRFEEDFPLVKLTKTFNPTKGLHWVIRAQMILIMVLGVVIVSITRG